MHSDNNCYFRKVSGDNGDIYHSAVTHAEWYYQKRTKTTTHYYKRWSSWGSWSDLPQTSTSIKEGQTRKMVRYRSK